jgi:hypothetical protein
MGPESHSPLSKRALALTILVLEKFCPLENLTLLPKKLLLLSFSIVLDSHRMLNESICHGLR